MVSNSKINEIVKLSKTAPVLAVGYSKEQFGQSTIIDGGISSKNLGVVNTATGLRAPTWLYGIMKGKTSHQIIIDGIDLIDKESQEKFYELLKYKAISDIDLPSDCNIIVLAKDLKEVSETIIRLCLLIK